MSYANGTTHYNLPQTVSIDKRDWTDTNQAFADVDAALYTAADTASTAASNISTLDAQINTPSTGIAAQLAAAQQDITSLDGRMDTAEGTITQHTNDIADVRADSSDMITAYNEPTATASHTYAVGDFFIYNNTLYKATAAIAINATIVPNTNCETTNVSTELIAIKSALTKKTLDVYVTSDGVKTISQLYDELNALVNYSKLNPKSVLYNPYDVYSLSNYDDNSHYAFFGNVRYSGGNMIIGSIRMVSSGSNNKSVSISMTDGTVTTYDGDSTVPSAGKQIGIIY